MFKEFYFNVIVMEGGDLMNWKKMDNSRMGRKMYILKYLELYFFFLMVDCDRWEMLWLNVVM